MKPERRRDAPISGKLRIAILLTCATALLCASAAMFAVQLQIFRRDYWRDIRASAETTASSAAAALSQNKPETAKRLLNLLHMKPHIVSARITKNDGGVFAQTGGAGGEDFERTITADGETLGTLRLRTDFDAQVMKLLGLHTVLFVAALGIAFLVALPISSRLLHSIFDPIKTLGETARQVTAQEDYSLRAEKAGEDEVGALTDTFNSMLTQIQERDQEVQRVHEQLLETSRKAGMAEVATGVIHNVGNVLNSVNVSATLVAEKLGPDRLEKLVRAANLLQERDAASLAKFLTRDPKGKVFPLYLAEVSAELAADRRDALAELASLRRNIEHIKEIVAQQQDHARVIGIVQPTQVAAAIEEALRMMHASLENSGITIVRDFGEAPDAMADPHQLLQIFVNLIRNARQAIDEAGPPERRLTIRVLCPDLRYVQAIFTDTGIGIAEENLTRVFAHGFTTRAHGHGFGLHSAALAAQQMAGCLSAHSDGPGTGATFTLELPLADA